MYLFITNPLEYSNSAVKQIIRIYLLFAFQLFEVQKSSIRFYPFFVCQ